jgi:hypothetical protein
VEAVSMTYVFLIGLEYQQQATVKAVCLSIWSLMRPQCIPKPTEEQWGLITLEFEKRANFPHCSGAVDRKHNRAIPP